MKLAKYGDKKAGDYNKNDMKEIVEALYGNFVGVYYSFGCWEQKTIWEILIELSDDDTEDLKSLVWTIDCINNIPLRKMSLQDIVSRELTKSKYLIIYDGYVDIYKKLMSAEIEIKESNYMYAEYIDADKDSDDYKLIVDDNIMMDITIRVDSTQVRTMFDILMTSKTMDIYMDIQCVNDIENLFEVRISPADRLYFNAPNSDNIIDKQTAMETYFTEWINGPLTSFLNAFLGRSIYRRSMGDRYER